MIFPFSSTVHVKPSRWHHHPYELSTLQRTANDTAAEEATEFILT